MAITKDNVETLPTLFKTYDTSTSLHDCKIWEVARATSAATTFFKPIKVGRDEIEFIDAAFGYNNPCEILIGEAKRQFPDRDQLKSMATSSKKVADRLDGQFGEDGQYYRFNVERGLEDVTLSDWEKASNISAHTRNYLAERERDIGKFVSSVVGVQS